ncbi:unnamed protein product [Auanema sp. JU1783]|nr:unnamed protein product [Auanema sp. JU1783]
MFRTVQSVRSLSVSAVRNQDLVQQAFVNKVREFGKKGGDLVNSDPAVKKALQDELNKLAMKFQLANADVVSKIPTNFETVKVESSLNELLNGKTISALVEEVNKEKAEYIASRDAKKASENARAASLKQ